MLSPSFMGHDASWFDKEFLSVDAQSKYVPLFVIWLTGQSAFGAHFLSLLAFVGEQLMSGMNTRKWAGW